MTPPSLPQEIIDKIIDQFSETARWNIIDRGPSKRVLASLSLVARAWKERSQKHLFSIIDFRKLPPMNIAEADLDELGPVFSLTRELGIDGRWATLSQLHPTAMALLRCFRNLDTLSLIGWSFRWLSAEQLSTCLGHLGETVIHLKLEGKASSGSLIYLTSMFPRLSVLDISITAVRDEETRGIISREQLPTAGSFQGYLYLWGLSDHDDFLAFLSSTSPKFDSICIDSCRTGDGVGKLLGSSAASLESLELYIDEDDPGANPTSLSECTQLRDVSISHPYPDSTAPLLQTIRSSHLKKFVVYFNRWSYGRSTRVEDADLWIKTDNEFCEAYDRWTKHVTGTIEVTFRVPGVERSGRSPEGYQSDLKIFFPRFTENVVVNIVC